MGAIADGFAAFAQPLIDQTDGSMEQLNKAFAIAQVCFNMALLPEAGRDQSIQDLRQSMPMEDEEFAEFERDIIRPMLRRHEEMFPLMHARSAASELFSFCEMLPHEPAPVAPAHKKPVVTNRYAPCPCNSGKKYKFCCGQK